MAKTVLVVGDSSSLRQVASIALRGAGYEVIEACDGKDALEKLSGQKAHLIISDLNNGIAFVKEAKKLPDYKFVPIIMLTGSSCETTW